VSKPRKATKQVAVAYDALTASRRTVPPACISRVDDLIEGLEALRDGLRRELGNAPTARERREHGA
jgi:hypothetical protein